MDEDTYHDTYKTIIVGLLVLLAIMFIVAFSVENDLEKEIDRHDMVLGSSICKSQHGEDYNVIEVHVSQGDWDKAYYEVRCVLENRKIIIGGN